jgi:3-oxoacyl-[acyl-carrier protein] reductase
MLLLGKTALITGASQGIGLSTLDLFALEGANILACTLKQEDSFEEHCSDLEKKYNIKIKPFYFDLNNIEETKYVLRDIASQFKEIDILVNVAGMTKDAIFQMVSLHDLRSVFEVNFISQSYLTQFVVKLMMRKKFGSIVNISSISAIDGNSGQYAYSSSKAAIIGATKTLSKELASYGIRVNCIAPGVIDTDMNKLVPQSKIEENISKMSIKRLGFPSEVAHTIVFLSSDLSNYITGQVLRVDGGMA